ncbi:MAG TPA: hypothetical protein VEP90_29455 [Methylomirabilota bacterium]|nr:hypothetical protein [Methylomirabilota bacterium]
MNLKILCKSGGAQGADTVFGRCAEAAGHEVWHYTFDDHNAHADNGILKFLTPTELMQADAFLLRANKSLKRTFPAKSLFVNNLLRRDYWQVRETYAVYAVAMLEDQHHMPTGGSAWAIQMAVDLRVPDIFLFDQLSNHWYQYLYSLHGWEILLPIDVIKPKFQSIYTGIGTRGLTAKGYAAIEELYK